VGFGLFAGRQSLVRIDDNYIWALAWHWIGTDDNWI